MTKVLLQIAAVLLLVSPAWAQRAGEVISVVGAPEVRGQQGDGWVAMVAGDEIRVGDKIRTGTGKAKILMVDDTVLTLDTGTQLGISKHMFRPKEKKRTGMFDLFAGRVKALVGSFFGETDVKFKTPTAVAGVRGTHFVIEVVPDSAADANGGTGGSGGMTRVITSEGHVVLTNSEGSIDIKGNMAGLLGASGAGQTFKLSNQELADVFNSVNFRSVSQILNESRKQAGQAGGLDGDIKQLRNTRPPSTSGAGTPPVGTTGSRGFGSGVGVGNDVPPATQESFEPGRGPNLRILWPSK